MHLLILICISRKSLTEVHAQIESAHFVLIQNHPSLFSHLQDFNGLKRTILFCADWVKFDIHCLLTSTMDSIVDSLNSAYQDFVAGAANVLEAKETSTGLKTAATDVALENFKQKWEQFRVACDQAEEFVESVKQRVGSECLVDEATGSVAGKSGPPGTAGIPPISAVRLEQMSKAVRWLVIELQQGSGALASSAHSQSSTPFDARFSEDAAQ